MSNPNSKKVTIFRKGTLLDSVQRGVEDFMSMSSKSIGSYWQSTNAMMPGSGLDAAEIKLLMPIVIGLPDSDREFYKKVKEYFESINTKIPHGKGLELEIGLLTSNTEPLSEKNLPIHISDYIRWRHASNHPQVATSKDAAEGNPLKLFYIWDPEQVQEGNSKRIAVKDKALEIYLQLKADKKKVYDMLVMLGEDPRGIREELRSEKLRELSESKPDSLVRLYEEKNFEEKVLLKTMVLTGVLRQVANRFIDAETSKILGNSEEEAIFFLKDKENSEAVLILKARMQELQTAAPVKKPSRKTTQI